MHKKKWGSREFDDLLKATQLVHNRVGIGTQVRVPLKRHSQPLQNAPTLQLWQLPVAFLIDGSSSGHIFASIFSLPLHLITPEGN